MFSMAEFNIIRKFEIYLNTYSVFLLSFLFHLPLIFQGLDVIDEGYHLTHQMASFASEVDVDHVSLMYFLSDFAGGFWLNLISKPCLLWARIGGLLLISINSSTIFSILSIYFERRKAFAAVLITALFITMRSGYIIDYYSFPAFLLCLQLWLLNQIIQHSRDQAKMKLFSFLLGLLTVPIILSRISLILLFLVPIALFVYYDFSNRDLSRAIQISKIASIGFASSAILFGIFYWYLGILSSIRIIFHTIWGSALGQTESHNMVNLIELYLRCYGEVVIGSIVLFGGFFVLMKFINSLKINEDYAQLIPILITIFALFLIQICSIYSPELAHSLAYPLLSVSIGLVVIFVRIFFYFNREANFKLALLLISGTITMLINPIGSNTGIFKSSYGMWLILPLSLLCLDKVWDRMDCISCNFRLSFLKTALTVMLIFALFFQFSNTNLDVPNRFELDTAFSDPSLSGIFSTPEKVEVVDELLSQIKSHSGKNDELLIVGIAPLFYYLTETKPVMGSPWLFITQDDIRIKHENVLKDKRYPKLVIVSKVDTLNWAWPNSKIEDSGIQTAYDYLVDEYLNKLNYTFLWENRAFEIYIRPDQESLFM